MIENFYFLCAFYSFRSVLSQINKSSFRRCVCVCVCFRVCMNGMEGWGGVEGSYMVAEKPVSHWTTLTSYTSLSRRHWRSCYTASGRTNFTRTSNEKTNSSVTIIATSIWLQHHAIRHPASHPSPTPTPTILYPFIRLLRAVTLQFIPSISFRPLYQRHIIIIKQQVAIYKPASTLLKRTLSSGFSAWCILL